MGTGKTFIGAAAAHMAGFQKVLVLCPPHLTKKWKREVEQTVPFARAVIVTSITDLEKLRLSVGSGPLFVVMSRERAKLSYRWKAAVIERWAVSKGRLVRDEETGEPFRVPCCPDCTAQIVDKDGVPLTDADLNRRKRVCEQCGAPLWQADSSSLRRYPLSDYVKHRMKGFFDLLVTDEVHEYKSRGSAQGIAAGILADACGKSLSLTGTVMGGYASTLFPPALPVSPLRSGRSSVAPTSTAGYSGTASRSTASASPTTTPLRTDATAAAASTVRWCGRGLASFPRPSSTSSGTRCSSACPTLRPVCRTTRSRCCSPQWTRRRIRRGSRSARPTTPCSRS